MGPVFPSDLCVCRASFPFTLPSTRKWTKKVLSLLPFDVAEKAKTKLKKKKRKGPADWTNNPAAPVRNHCEDPSTPKKNLTSGAPSLLTFTSEPAKNVATEGEPMVLRDIIDGSGAIGRVFARWFGRPEPQSGFF